MKHPSSLAVLAFLWLFAIFGCTTSNQRDPITFTDSANRYSPTNTATGANTNALANAEPNNQNTSLQPTARVISTRANIREQPTTDSEAITEVSQGDMLTLIGGRMTRGWFHVRTTNSDNEGWIHGNSIELIARQPINRTRTANSSVQPPIVRAQPTPQPQTQEATVYITRTGAKYHSAGCRYLSRSMIPISLDDARRGYDPCSVCRPPR